MTFTEIRKIPHSSCARRLLTAKIMYSFRYFLKHHAEKKNGPYHPPPTPQVISTALATVSSARGVVLGLQARDGAQGPRDGVNVNQRLREVRPEFLQLPEARVVDLGDLYTEKWQTLQGSISAVSKPNFASKY